MANLKEFLSELSSSLNNNELSALAGASGIPEIDVSDSVIDAAKGIKSLMTVEAAQNNTELLEHFKKKLHPALKGELLGNFDTDLVQVSKELLGDDKSKEISEIDFSGDKLKKFSEYTKELILKGSGDDKLKNTNEALKKQMEDLQKSFTDELAQKDKSISELKSGYTQKLIDKQLDSELASFELGEKYNEGLFKKAIFSEIKSKIPKVAKLILTDEMEIGIRNPENDDLDLIVDNKKVETIKDIITPLIQPFVKKASGKPVKKDGTDYVPAQKTDMSTLAQDMVKRKANTTY